MQFEFGFADGPQGGIRAKKVTTRQVRPHVKPPHPVLPGLELRRTHKLFVALRLDGPAAAKAAAIPRQIGVKQVSYLVPPCNLHATLHLVAQQEGVPKSLLEKAREAIGAVSIASFEVTFDRLESFVLGRSRHALVLLCGHGLERLAGLHREIGTALRRSGFRHIGKSFVPHVTLAYDGEPFATPPIMPVAWTVDRFVLIDSPQGKREHFVSGSWTLHE